MNQIDLVMAKHQQEIERLTKLEGELFIMVSETGNDALIEKMLEWIKQRETCNNSYISVLEQMV